MFNKGLNINRQWMPSRPSFLSLPRMRMSSIFDTPEDQTIDIGNEKPSYKGSLVVVPTPIGNLGDLSVR